MTRFFIRAIALALTLSTASCGLSVLQLAQYDVAISADVIAASNAVWPAILGMIPAASQPQAQKDFNLAILAISTQEAVVQDAINAGQSQNLVAELAALDDAITKIVTLIDAFQNATKISDPTIVSAIAELHARASLAHQRNSATRARMVR